MTLRTNSFDGGQPGVQVSTTNSGGSSGTAFDGVPTGTGATIEYTNIHARGGNAIRIQSGSFAGQVRVDWIETLSEDYGRGYFFYDGTANPAGDMSLVQWKTTANSNCALLRWATGAGNLFVQDVSFASVTGGGSTTILPFGQWFRLDWHFVPGAGTGSITVQLFITNPEGTTPDETLTASSQQFGADFGRTVYGFITTLANIPSASSYLYMDDIVRGAAALPGPADPVAGYAPRRMPIL